MNAKELAMHAAYTEQEANVIAEAAESARTPFPEQRVLMAQTIIIILQCYNRPASDADRVRDVIDWAVDNSVCTFKDVTRFIRSAAPMASTLRPRQDMSELLAAYGDLTRHGVTAERAHRQMMDNLTRIAQREEAAP